MNANQLGAVFEGRIPSARELQNITEELGAEMATGILLKILQDSPLHGNFARKLRETEVGNRAKGFNEIEVAVIASNHFASGRKWGDHVDAWRSWARDLGFRTETIETSPSSTVADNARTIRDYLNTNPHPNRILVSYGQGATEFRYLVHRLHALKSLDELKGVAGWMNVCGAFYGSSLSEFHAASPLRRWNEKLKMKWAGRNPLALMETASGFNLWKQLAPIPREVTTVNLVGLPLRIDIPNGLHFSYETLARSQPNDGVVKFLESVAHPGFIVPLTGMNHRAPDQKLKIIFQRSLVLLGRAIEEKKSPNAGPGFELDY